MESVTAPARLAVGVSTPVAKPSAVAGERDAVGAVLAGERPDGSPLIEAALLDPVDGLGEFSEPRLAEAVLSPVFVPDEGVFVGRT